MPQKGKVKSFEEIYSNMCDLKRDLYYKEIISAHKDLLIKKTKEQTEDIFYCYKKNYISKNEMFTQLEGMKVKNHIIDQVVYDALSYARKTFCKKTNSRKNYKS
jgi:hypothetical protein